MPSPIHGGRRLCGILHLLVAVQVGVSFGLELVRVLAHQLNGELHILKGSGTTFSLTFQGEQRLLRSAS